MQTMNAKLPPDGPTTSRLGGSPVEGAPVRWIATAVILILTLAVYLAALDGPFLLDDFTSVLPARPNGTDWHALAAVTFGNESGTLGRPVPTLSFALQFLAGADDPKPFKAFNLGVHLVNVLLFALLLDRLTASARFEASRADESGSMRLRTVAFLAAVAVFALHPIQVSTVMYTVQRMALMSHTFGLGAMLLYVIARQRQGDSMRSRLAAAAGVVLLVALSMLCKENGALVPAYILLIELVIFRAPWASGRSVAGREHVGLSNTSIRFALVACVSVLSLATLLAFRLDWLDPLMTGYDSRRFTLEERLASQPVVLLEYLRMIAWPDPSFLSFHHDDIDVGAFSTSDVTFASLAVLAMFGAMIAAVGRMPLVASGIGLYLASHLVESTIFPIEAMFEHRNYVGLTGIGLLVTGLLEATRSIRSATTITVVVLVSLVTATSQRNVLWSNDLTIERHAVTAAPDSLRARAAYAIALSRDGAIDAAVAQLDAAADLAPEDPYFPLARLQTLALVDRTTPEDVVHAARVLDTGELSLPTEAVLVDLQRNLEDGLLPGFSAASLSDLYTIAERRYGDFATTDSHARLVAAAAEAHLAAGRNDRALSSIDRSANLAPKRHRIAVRRLELRAGLAPESVDMSEVGRLAEFVPDSEATLHERLAAVSDHLSR